MSAAEQRTGHSERAAEFVADSERTGWHDRALWFVRAKRDRAAQAVPDWEALRDAAAEIKRSVLSRLDLFLEEFERNATALGAQVHWARDAEEHNRIVLSILERAGAKRIVKSKSMLTEECGLNAFLETRGLEVTDTDLGEWIVQLRHEPPSHIVLPAIHIKKSEIAKLFADKIQTDPANDDPAYLTEQSRIFLRKRFQEADAAISGVNFAVAETGGIVVCTNEGNADLGTSLARVHIACMGLEKIVPREKDLGVFLRLLARSATGQPITTYSSHFLGSLPGAELHIVLVDNGRTSHLAAEEFRRALSCIRCGACLNTCPVYRRSGGYSYATTVPGPIGSVLAPHRDPKRHASLPFASSLCGSCTDVCPVKINLHEQLLLWRKRLVGSRAAGNEKRLAMRFGAFVLARPWLFAFAGGVARLAIRLLPRAVLYHRMNVWGRARELPEPPAESFRKWYARERGGRRT